MAVATAIVIQETKTPIISIAQYAKNDVVGGLLTFTAFNRATGGSGIRTVVLVDNAGQGAAIRLWLFNEKPLEIDDTVQYAAIPKLDLSKLFGIIDIEPSDYLNVGSIKVAVKHFLPDVAYLLVGGNVFVYMVTIDSEPTYTQIDDLVLKFIVWNN